MSDVTPGAPDHGTSSPPAGDAGNRVNGRVHDRPGRNGGDHRAADDPRRPARQHLDPGLDDQRLQPGLRGTDLDRYRAGRQVRPPPGLHGRGGAVHTGLGRLRGQPQCRRLDRRPRRAGRGRGNRHAAEPGADQRGVSTVPPQHGGRGVGAITGISVGFRPVVGGTIVQGLAWQWVLWLNVPVGLALVAVGGRVLAMACRARLPAVRRPIRRRAGSSVSGAGRPW